MANRTDSSADTVHGTNPQYLVDRIIRNKIYNDAYWKEFCFGLTTESLVDRAAEIDYVGGTYGGRRRPTKFLCLFLKMLQIQPDEDVVLEYIKQPDLKYLRALGVAYYRISSRHVNVYTTLEPLFADYRKLRYRDMTGKLSIIHMDEFVDWLFREKTVCDVTMPGIPKREILEATLDLPPRESVLEDDLEDLEDLEELAEPQGEQSEPREQRGSPSPDVAAAEARQDAASPQPARPSRSRSARRSESRKRRPKERAASRSASASLPRERAREKEGKSHKEGKADREEQGEKKADKKDKREKKDKKEKAVKDTGDRREEERRHGKKEKKKDKDGLSVEEWNQIREEMGLKPLKK